MATNGSIDRCYWTDTARNPGSHGGPLQGEIEADVAIVGGGIVGVIAARLLKERGRRVALLEAGRVGHGVTGRSTAKVTAQHTAYLQRIADQHGASAARIYAAANQAGVELINELVRRHGLECDFEPADSWVYATTDDGARKLETERDAAVAAGLPMELLGEVDLPFPITGALRLGRQYQFQPVDFVAQLAGTLPGDGCTVFEHSLVTDWGHDWVRTSSGCVRSSLVVMATHLPLGQVGMYDGLTYPHMHAIMAVPVEAGHAPAGMYITVDQPKRSIRSHRRHDGNVMLILTGPVFDHGDVAGAQDAFAQLEEFAREHFGYRGGAYRWGNEDYASKDGLPFIGWSGSAGESPLVATGFDAWGLSNGAAGARIIADLCDGAANPWIEAFDASRDALGNVGRLAGSAASFVRKITEDHVHRPPSAKANGAAEGDVVEIDGRAVGVFRGPDGGLRAVSAVCTHLGCMLGWNPIDRTWDCPCHGSRFAADGAIVHGPATEPLGEIDWPAERQEA